MPVATLQVTVSPHTRAARPVAITLVARYEMQCGWPGPGALVIRFPAGMRLPTSFPAGSVRLDGRPATASRPAPGTVSVALPRRPRIMCDLIGTSAVTVSFTRAARLGNPRSAGSYTVHVQHVADAFSGRLAISRA